MNYKLLVYAFTILLSIYVASCIDFEKIIRKNKVVEAKILAILFSLALAYLLTNFIFDFIECSQII